MQLAFLPVITILLIHNTCWHVRIVSWTAKCFCGDKEHICHTWFDTFRHCIKELVACHRFNHFIFVMVITSMDQVTCNSEQILIELTNCTKVEENDFVLYIIAVTQTNKIITEVRIGLHFAPFKQLTYCNFQRSFA